MLTRMLSTAVTNARRGVADISRSNRDRRRLEPLTESPGGPGDVTRLSRDECFRLMASRRFGRFAHVESARALDIVVVNYVSRPDGSVLFRTGPGPKLSAAERGDVVAFQIDDIDEQQHTGWSVLVVGRARRLSQAEVGQLTALPQAWATGPRHQFVHIEPTRIEGRRLT
jgi:uncharacterized protein